MSVVQTYGKPDLFIIMTCNPKCKQITENFNENENALDRPYLVS